MGENVVTVYLCGASVVIATAIGIPLGVLSAENDRANRIAGAMIDTLQTLPSFVYLIPVVMLFRVGTRDLGQEVYIALTKADSGRGIIAGMSVAFIAIIADRILSASSRHARARLGLE